MRPGEVGRAKHGGVQQSNTSASNGSARNGPDDVEVITSEVQGQEADRWSMLMGLHIVTVQGYGETHTASNPP